MSTPPSGGHRRICETAGTRLDRFVSDQWGPLTRRHTRAIIAAGAVRVNGQVARKGTMLQVGDSVEVAATALANAMPAGDTTLAVPVLYEDAALIALDKPSGMPSVALHGDERGSVANFLLGLAPETAQSGRSALEAGLVHRLDTGTSGVLLAARSANAWQALREQFQARKVDKRYLALVEGSLTAGGVIADPIAHYPRRPRRMLVCRDAEQALQLAARSARTTYRPVERIGDATLVEVSIDAGVRHQIRVHLAALGHPVRGDTLYGGGPATRLLLHSHRLGFRHPVDRRVVTIESPLPTGFR